MNPDATTMPATRNLPETPEFSLRAEDDGEGYEVLRPSGGLAGYVYPDICGGWKPYSIHGRAMRTGCPASPTPERAAAHLFLA